MPDAHRERELTFDLPDGWAPPAADRFVPSGGSLETEVVRLESTYYDTVNRSLLGARMTLRRRTGDTDTGWHLKVPDGNARLELHEPLTSARAVPAELRRLTAGVRGRAALRPVATLHTERAVQRIVGADGVGLVEIVHDTVIANTHEQFAVNRSWHEAEVELLDGGDEQLLASIAKWLIKRGARPAAVTSKLARALDVETQTARPTDAVADAVGAYLDAQFAALVGGDVTLRRDDAVIDVVHATRVATRRYRSTLRVFGDALDAGRAEALDVELSWYAAALGQVRDRQVLRRHVDRALDDLPPDLVVGGARERIDAAIATEEQTARTALAEVMASARYVRLMAELASWRADLPLLDERTGGLGRHLERAERKLASRLRRAERSDASDEPAEFDGVNGPDEAYHRARKAAKRLRYAAELATPALGKRAKKLGKRAKKLQTSLGDRQDTALAMEFLLRLGTEPGVSGFTLGLLYERERTER